MFGDLAVLLLAMGCSLQIVTQRLMQLQMKGTPSHMPAWVHIKRRKRNSHGQHYWEVVKAKGHMDEVHALTKAAGASCTSMTVSSCTSRGPSVMLNVMLVHVASSLAKLFTSTSGSHDVVCQRLSCVADAPDANIKLYLVEGKVLGGGAFSRVSKVVEESNQRAYAMKRMRKATVLQCPDHVFCEQLITRNTAHPFCIRQVRPGESRRHVLLPCAVWHVGTVGAFVVKNCTLVCSTPHSRIGTTYTFCLTCCLVVI
jgi:cGMP-dependent protein kinase 2